MPYAASDDGIRLYFEETGSGIPTVFVHEFAGDHRSWEPQVRHFSGTYRCIVFAARGYPPSDVPTEQDSYSQDLAIQDLLSVLDAAQADKAFIVGNSMGGFTALLFALRHPDRTLGSVVAGCGYGAHPDQEPVFREACEKIATAFEVEGSQAMSRWYGFGPTRVQYEAKDPPGHAEHLRILSEHDPIGAALTMRGVQMRRPSLYSMRDELAACEPPILVLAGDEDDPALEADLMLKRTIPRCGLAVLPKSGHLTNLEESELFDQFLERFFAAVQRGEWTERDPRAQSRTP